MKKLFVLVVGIGIGMVAAHFVSRTPRGAALFAELDERVGSFTDAVVDGFQQRQTELRDR